MEKLFALGPWTLATLIGAFVGSFLAGYMKRKGENLATHEDLQKLVDQMRAVTQATKEIEAKISDKSWDRQKQWEMKRDALVAALVAFGRSDDEMRQVATAYYLARKSGAEEAQWKETKREASQSWGKEITDYDAKRGIVMLVCGQKTIDALSLAGRVMRLSAKKVFDGEADSYDAIGEEIQKARADALRAAREELGIETT